MGVVVHHLVIKIAPDQFGQPNGRAFRACLSTFKCQRGQLADRHRAKPQMHRQVAGAFDDREVAGAFVIIHARQEVLQQHLCAVLPPLHPQGRQVHVFKTH